MLHRICWLVSETEEACWSYERSVMTPQKTQKHDLKRKHKVVDPGNQRQEGVNELHKRQTCIFPWDVKFYYSHWRKSVSTQPPRRSEVRVSYTAGTANDFVSFLRTRHSAGWMLSDSEALTGLPFLKVTCRYFAFLFLISADRHHYPHHLTCWLWSLWVSGQRSSPEPRHTGRRASHWGCSSGSCRRFWSCPLRTLSVWRTRASVTSPPWWKGLRKGDLKNTFG